MLPKALERAPSGGSKSEVYLGAPFLRVFLGPSIEEMIEVKGGVMHLMLDLKHRYIAMSSLRTPKSVFIQTGGMH